MDFEESKSHLAYLKALVVAPTLSHLSLKFSGSQVTHEVFEILCEHLPKAPSLKVLSLDLLNSQVSETEIVLLGQALPHLTQIEQITLKIIQ